MIELKFKDGRKLDVAYPFELKDSRGNTIYRESGIDSVTHKYAYDSNGNCIHYENSAGEWSKQEYDENSKETYFENHYSYWRKSEYDDTGNLTYCEDSNGTIEGTSKHDVVEMTMEEICKKLGKNVKVIK